MLSCIFLFDINKNVKKTLLLIKILSCKATSKEALANTIPVNPPIVNKIKNPRTNKVDEVL